MASERGLSIASGIAQGLEKATSNLWSIMQAGAKIKREREVFDMDMKIKKIQLQKLEGEVDPETVERDTKLHKQQVAAGKAAFTLSGTLQRKAESTAEFEVEKLQKAKRLEAAAGFGDPGETDPYIRNLMSGDSQSTVTREAAEKEYFGIAGEKLTESKRKVVGFIRAAREKNKSLENIHKYIQFKGYEPEDFEEELEGYSPVSFEKDDPLINKRNLWGMGQKYDRRVKNGKTYEKRSDDLWHLITK